MKIQGMLLTLCAIVLISCSGVTVTSGPTPNENKSPQPKPVQDGGKQIAQDGGKKDRRDNAGPKKGDGPKKDGNNGKPNQDKKIPIEQPKFVVKQFYITPTNDAGMAKLREMPDLEELTVNGSKLTPAGLKQLTALKKLEKLNFQSTPAAFQEEGLRVLKELPNLKSVSFFNCGECTTAIAARLKALTGLKGLSLDRVEGNDVLGQLKELTNLEALKVSSFTINDAGVAHLSGLTKLQDLNLHVTSVTDAGLVYLKGMKDLKDLDIGFTKVTSKGLVHLEGLKNLEHLDLAAQGGVGDAGLAHLKGLTNMKHLGLLNTSVTDNGLANLEGMTQLTTLDLRCPLITDAGLEHLRRLKQLKRLELFGSKVTKKRANDLKKSIPGLQFSGVN